LRFLPAAYHDFYYRVIGNERPRIDVLRQNQIRGNER
jgi:hypothetical protein